MQDDIEAATIYMQEVLNIQGNKMLVHGAHGVSLSPLPVIAFLMEAHQVSLYDAYVTVKSARVIVKPDPTFCDELLEYERYTYRDNSILLEQLVSGSVDGVWPIHL